MKDSKGYDSLGHSELRLDYTQSSDVSAILTRDAGDRHCGPGHDGISKPCLVPGWPPFQGVVDL